MAFEQQCRRRGSSNPAASSSLDAILASSSSSAAVAATATATAIDDRMASTTATEQQARSSLDGKPIETELESATAMSPRSATNETHNDTRSARSTSTTSRNSNRLSLTLPIALPNSLPSRPIPTPSSSVPPTPLETSAVTSPTDPNEFIVAIAAQERRVLELREELLAAEGELRRLKKQFTVAEGYKKRATQRTNESLRAMAALTGQADSTNNYEQSSPAATQRTSELERRKAILLAQSQGTPREYKRTVIRGGHARALSLLSPTRPVTEFPALEDLENNVRRSIDSSSTSSSRPHDWKPKSAAMISKRATWAPRQTQPPNGVKQIANDFKQGLWTFVEDLRQATVGDEAISGKFNRTAEMAARLNQVDTIRASSATPNSMNRGRIPFPTETSSETSTPIRSNFSSSSGSFNERLQQQERQKKASGTTSNNGEPAAPAAAATKARKHFSWTPLTFDQFDDDDWSNWDTPTVKQSRWSGSTVNGDIIPAPVSDRSDENEGTLRRKRSLSELRSASQSPTPNASIDTVSKLEELPQVILNSLSPGNIKRTAAEFMREWEKSLSPPADAVSNTFFGENDVEALARAAAHAQ